MGQYGVCAWGWYRAGVCVWGGIGLGCVGGSMGYVPGGGIGLGCVWGSMGYMHGGYRAGMCLGQHGVCV